MEKKLNAALKPDMLVAIYCGADADISSTLDLLGRSDKGREGGRGEVQGPW
jgi:hypothetical protein